MRTEAWAGTARPRPATPPESTRDARLRAHAARTGSTAKPAVTRNAASPNGTTVGRSIDGGRSATLGDGRDPDPRCRQRSDDGPRDVDRIRAVAMDAQRVRP